MELDELKETWKTSNPVHYNREELDSIFEIKTRRSLKSINRSMLNDAFLMVLATAGFITLTFILGLKSRYVISGELVLVATLLGIHYRIKYLTINKINLNQNSIKEAISLIIKKVRVYLVLYKVLTPLIAGGLYLLYEVNAHYYQAGSYSLADPVFSLGIAAGIALLALVLTHLITRAMYGRELGRLRQLHDDLSRL